MEVGDYIQIRLRDDDVDEKTYNVILYKISGADCIPMFCDEVDAQISDKVNLGANRAYLTRYLLHRAFSYEYYFEHFDRGAEKWVCM